MAKLTLRDLDLKDKTVLLRADFNVPLDKEGKIADDTRIRETLPTIRHLMQNAKKVVACSHLGRPRARPVPQFSLAPVADRLSELLGRHVALLPDCVGPLVQKMVAHAKPGAVLLLENLRFHREEEAGDERFAKELASLGDLFVNDAFGAAHRPHASISGVPKFLKSAAGFLLEKEIKFLKETLDRPDRPFVAILGGAKVSDKIKVIENLLPRVDALLVGGAMAYTFLKAKGQGTGNSLVEPDHLETARRLLALGEQKEVAIELPSDHFVARKIEPNAEHRLVESIEEGWMGLDIGPKTTARFMDWIGRARTVLWNGPLGVFETPPFGRGTTAIAQAVALARGTTIVGGGDTAAAVAALKLKDRMTHVSTGGGASLEFMEGRGLPGIECLAEKA